MAIIQVVKSHQGFKYFLQIMFTVLKQKRFFRQKLAKKMFKVLIYRGIDLYIIQYHK